MPLIGHSGIIHTWATNAHAGPTKPDKPWNTVLSYEGKSKYRLPLKLFASLGSLGTHILVPHRYINRKLLNYYIDTCYTHLASFGCPCQPFRINHQLPSSPSSAQAPMLAIELTIQKVIPAQQNRPMKSTMVCIHWGASGKLTFGGPYPTSLLVNIHTYIHYITLHYIT